MKIVRVIMVVLALAVVAGKAVSMLPPQTFHDPIFAQQAQDDDSDSGEYSMFA